MKTDVTHSGSSREEMLLHVFPRHRRDIVWDVVIPGAVHLEENVSLSCELFWTPIKVMVSSLRGKLLERTEELVVHVSRMLLL